MAYRAIFLATISPRNLLKLNNCIELKQIEGLKTISRLNKGQIQYVQQNKPQQMNVNVAGLSEAVCAKNDGPVGPGALKTGEYKVPEYFNYNKDSYFQAEVEMSKYRLKQPSSIKK